MSNYIQDMGRHGMGHHAMGGLGWGSVKEIGGSLAKGVVNIFGEGKKAEGAAEYAAQQAALAQQQRGGMPSWIVPVGLGVVGLVAIVLLTRKK